MNVFGDMQMKVSQAQWSHLLRRSMAEKQDFVSFSTDHCWRIDEIVSVLIISIPIQFNLKDWINIPYAKKDETYSCRVRSFALTAKHLAALTILSLSLDLRLSCRQYKRQQGTCATSSLDKDIQLCFSVTRALSDALVSELAMLSTTGTSQRHITTA